MARVKKNETQITFETTEEELKNIFGDEVNQITKHDVVLIRDGDNPYLIKNEEWEKELTQTEYEKVRVLLLGSKNYAKSKQEIRKEGFININKNLF